MNFLSRESGGFKGSSDFKESDIGFTPTLFSPVEPNSGAFTRCESQTRTLERTVFKWTLDRFMSGVNAIRTNHEKLSL